MSLNRGIIQRKSIAEWPAPRPRDKGCDSSTHDESACWGVCPHCGQRGHQANFCRYKKNNDLKQNTQQPGRADKVAQKGKKNRKRKAGKRVATVTDSNSRRESEEEESEISEEESPMKEERPQTHNSRSVRLAQFQPLSAVRSLNEQLSNMDDDETRDLKL